jgi:hypothetical protein
MTIDSIKFIENLKRDFGSLHLSPLFRQKKKNLLLHDFRLALWCKCDLRSSGILRNVDIYLPKFRDKLSVHFQGFTLEDATEMFRNVGN